MRGSLIRGAALIAALALVGFTAQGAAASSVLQKMQQEIMSLAKQIEPSVVKIVADSGGGLTELSGERMTWFSREEVGSGVVFDRQGYIVTTSGVVGTSETVMVETADGREFAGEVLGLDPETNLAVIQVDAAAGLEPLESGSAESLPRGAWLLFMGWSRGDAPTHDSGHLTRTMAESDGDFLEASARPSPGHSGGAVVDVDGKLVGLIAGVMSEGPQVIPFGAGQQYKFIAGKDSDAPGALIPVETLQSMVPRLIRGEKIQRGWLGVYLSPISEGESGGDTTATGVRILKVVSDSPAAKAGLKEKDVIVSYDGRPLQDLRDLTRYVRRTAPGTTVEMEIARKGTRKSVPVEIGTAKDTPTWFAKKGTEHELFKKLVGSRAFLGVELQDLTGDLGEYFGIDESQGALISKVVEGTPAEKAGLRAGDVIVQIGNTKVESSSDVTVAIAKAEPGDVVSIEYFRKGDARTTTATLGEHELSSEDNEYIFRTPSVTVPSIRVPAFGLKKDQLRQWLDQDEVEELKESFEELKEEMLELKRELETLRTDERRES